MFKKAVIKLLGIIVFIGVVFAVNGLINNGLEKVQADSGDNISGYNWSENIGWISFNNTSDGSLIGYGVNIDSDSGDLSGYAWSEHIGWISFNRSDTGNPPSPPYRGGSGAIAKYDISSGELTGWFRVLANGGGWDGWIRFCDTGISNCSGSNQIAKIDSNGNWHGWAWSDAVVGWISFNGADSGAGGDYNVNIPGGFNRPPTVSDFKIIQYDYSAIPSHYFSWIYSDPDGNDEVRFQFQVDDNSDFSSPEVDETVIGTWADGDTNNQTVIVEPSPDFGQIGYNTAYYWRVKVWDSNEVDSDWTQYSDSADSDGDGDSQTFTTELHRYPSADFKWSPKKPSQDEDILFSDKSVCYDINNNLTDCVGWLWTFEDGNPDSSVEQNPIIQFTDDGSSKQVTLQVTDPDGFTCSDSKSVGVKSSLPRWKEILPQ